MRSILHFIPIFIIWFYHLIPIGNGLFPPHPDQDKTTPEFITSYGYPLETHTIITSDGYILKYFRIPHGRNNRYSNSKLRKRPTVLFLHGLLLSSASFFIQQRQTMLPFLLADAGYDVWLGNSRGTTYSTGHLNPSYNSDIPINGYWNFSWEEMGIYDTPAAIDYILKSTGHKSIFIIGHSQGTTQLLVMLSLLPEYNKKIKLAINYSPVAFMGHIKGPISALGPITNAATISSANGLVKSYLGIGEFIPRVLMKILHKIIPQLCDVTLIKYGICANIVFIVAGYDFAQTDFSRVAVSFSMLPDTASTNQVLHYAQLMDPILHTFKFDRFDYGPGVNLKKYGSTKPPRFNLSAVTAPFALYYGENDWLAQPNDVIHLRKNLPNVVEFYRVPHDNWNHLDFLIGKNAFKWLYQPTMKLMKRFLY